MIKGNFDYIKIYYFGTCLEREKEKHCNKYFRACFCICIFVCTSPIYDIHNLQKTFVSIFSTNTDVSIYFRINLQKKRSAPCDILTGSGCAF